MGPPGGAGYLLETGARESAEIDGHEGGCNHNPEVGGGKNGPGHGSCCAARIVRGGMGCSWGYFSSPAFRRDRNAYGPATSANTERTPVREMRCSRDSSYW